MQELEALNDGQGSNKSKKVGLCKVVADIVVQVKSKRVTVSVLKFKRNHLEQL